MYSILCTGSSGLVASHFKQTAIDQGINFIGLDLSGEKISADITNKVDFEKVIEKLLPELNGSQPVLFHFAAIPITGTNLTKEQLELSNKVNVEGTRNVLEVCRQFNIPMVHISTDFVFSAGKKRNPYLPTDEICPDDTNYSQTKAEAEKIVLAAKNDQQVNIIRIAFPYGNMSHFKQGLLRKILTWMDNNDEVGLYSDQQTCPTPISHISNSCIRTAELITNKDILSGIILHVVGQPTTPFEFGETIKQVFEKEVILNKTSISGNTPTNLVLDTTDTEKYLGFSAPSHEEEFRKLKIIK